MLVLSRKNGQKLIIGDDIEITIIESSNNSVKLGINAPKNVTVYREEVYLEIKKENELSKNANINSLLSLESLISSNQKTNNKLLNVTNKI